MTVEELMNELAKMDRDAKVHFSYNYGDYWGTEVSQVISRASKGVVKYSEYHGMYKIVDNNNCSDEENSNDDKDTVSVILLE
jgi:hypothetical protein